MRKQNSIYGALLLTLLVVACSKGDGKSLSSPPPQTLPAQSAGKPAQSNTGDLDHQSSTDSNHQVDAPAPDGNGSSTDQSQQPQQQPQQQSATTPAEVIMDPTGMTPDQIFSSSQTQGAAPLGTRASVIKGEPLFYSGASQDFLHEQLREQADSEHNKAQLARNQKFAHEIGLATFEVNWSTREAKLSVNVTAEGKTKNLNYVGALDNELKISGHDASRGLSYEAICMDLSGGCHTTHVRLKQRVSGGTAVANVIVRLSNAYLYVDGNPPGASRNAEYDNLINLFLNSANAPGSPGSIQALGFYTSETIYGSSSFAILMRLGVQDPNKAAGDAQVMGLMGPLVKHSKSMDESVHIDNPPMEPTIVGKRTFMLSSVIVNTIREVRMMRNDGRGNLQFNITVRKNNQASSEDTIRLTVARLQTESRSPILP